MFDGKIQFDLYTQTESGRLLLLMIRLTGSQVVMLETEVSLGKSMRATLTDRDDLLRTKTLNRVDICFLLEIHVKQIQLYVCFVLIACAQHTIPLKTCKAQTFYIFGS